MNRRRFIKTTSLASLAFSIPVFSSVKLQQVTFDELVGKGNPSLFGDHYKLKKDAHEAFLKMKSEATNAGINIQIVSSYRHFNHQNRIWSNKYKKFIKQGLFPEQAIEKIIEYSTIPGTSRHHWGTDIDIIDGIPKQPKNVLNAMYFEENGPFYNLKKWLDKHAESFGFYLVYTNEKNRNGFKYEPWHYSYKPLSQSILKAYQKIDLMAFLQNENIIGKEYFTETFIKSYLNYNILDINTDLL